MGKQEHVIQLKMESSDQFIKLIDKISLGQEDMLPLYFKNNGNELEISSIKRFTSMISEGFIKIQGNEDSYISKDIKLGFISSDMLKTIFSVFKDEAFFLIFKKFTEKQIEKLVLVNKKKMVEIPLTRLIKDFKNLDLNKEMVFELDISEEKNEIKKLCAIGAKQNENFYLYFIKNGNKYVPELVFGENMDYKFTLKLEKQIEEVFINNLISNAQINKDDDGYFLAFHREMLKNVFDKIDKKSEESITIKLNIFGGFYICEKNEQNTFNYGFNSVVN